MRWTDAAGATAYGKDGADTTAGENIFREVPVKATNAISVRDAEVRRARIASTGGEP